MLEYRRLCIHNHLEPYLWQSWSFHLSYNNDFRRHCRALVYMVQSYRSYRGCKKYETKKDVNRKILRLEFEMQRTSHQGMIWKQTQLVIQWSLTQNVRDMLPLVNTKLFVLTFATATHTKFFAFRVSRKKSYFTSL